MFPLAVRSCTSTVEAVLLVYAIPVALLSFRGSRIFRSKRCVPRNGWVCSVAVSRRCGVPETAEKARQVRDVPCGGEDVSETIRARRIPAAAIDERLLGGALRNGCCGGTAGESLPARALRRRRSHCQECKLDWEVGAWRRRLDRRALLHLNRGPGAAAVVAPHGHGLERHQLPRDRLGAQLEHFYRTVHFEWQVWHVGSLHRHRDRGCSGLRRRHLVLAMLHAGHVLHLLVLCAGESFFSSDKSGAESRRTLEECSSSFVHFSFSLI